MSLSSVLCPPCEAYSAKRGDLTSVFLKQIFHRLRDGFHTHDLNSIDIA